MLCPRRRIFVVFIVSPILGLLLIYHLFHGQGQGRSDLGSSYYPFPFTFSSTTSTKTEVDTTDGYGYGDTDAAIHCPEIPGLDNILVILKTGVTEAFDKIPVHVRTTLKCVPHYAIFSDYEEDIIITDEKEMKVSKVRSIDVLRNVSQEIKETSPDFDLYNRVQRAGRAGLQHADVNRDKDDGNSPFGKQDNPGWRLDKWKFLPMVDEALQIRPEAEWFVFIEADTYVVWSNLERWLARLDSSQPLYLGSPMQIGDVLFAYGGAGIVLSNPAMRQVSEYRAQQIEELDRYTDMHWAGDCVLGNALADVGIPLSWAWPMMQTSQVWELDHISQGYGRRPWCHPAVSYHHMTAEDIKSMWRFDQEWFGQHAQKNNTSSSASPMLLHRNVFHHLILNFISSSSSSPGYTGYTQKENWDNLSHRSSPPTPTPSFAACAQRCTEDIQCLQFSYEDGSCSTANAVLRGVGRPGIESGWMVERIERVAQQMGQCEVVEYMP